MLGFWILLIILKTMIEQMILWSQFLLKKITVGINVKKAAQRSPTCSSFIRRFEVSEVKCVDVNWIKLIWLNVIWWGRVASSCVHVFYCVGLIIIFNTLCCSNKNDVNKKIKDWNSWLKSESVWTMIDHGCDQINCDVISCPDLRPPDLKMSLCFLSDRLFCERLIN